MVKGFEAELSKGSYRLTKLKSGTPTGIDEDTLHFGFGKSDTLRIDPVAKGGKKKGLGKIILGTIIVVGAFMLAPATGGMSMAAMSNVAFGAGTVFATTFATIATQGALLALYGVSEMIAASKQSVGEKNASHVIDATGNITAQGSAIPVVFGEAYVGSVVVSGGTFVNEIEPHKDRGKYDSNMRSSATARILDVISEGPIEGIVDGEKGIYLGNTPLMNADGSANFSGVSWTDRRGFPDQKHVKGYSLIEREINTGNREIRQETPYSFNISDENVDAVRVKFQLPRFGKSDDGFHSIERDLQVEVKAADKPWGEPYLVRFDGKSTGPYERNLRIDLPEGSAPWTVRVTRLSENSTKEKYADQTFVPSYTEIIDAKLSYPDTALVGLTFDAAEFGTTSVPERTFHVRGVKTEVPSNYDPLTRTYSGLWDGTFKVAWHNNPAWVLWALQTHPRFGLGDILDKSAVDKFALYEIAQRCDGLVPDGKGGKEPRYTFNGAIRSREEAHKVLDGIAATFRGMLYWGAGIVTTTQDAPEPPSVLVTNANVIDGDFHYAGGALSARHSSVSVKWANPDEQGKVVTSVVQRDDLIQKFGDRRTDIVVMGCTSESQARRAADWLLYTEEFEAETVSYSASLDHMAVRPGTIISIADQHLAQVRFGGRLKNATDTGFDTDAPVEFAPGKSYTVSVVHNDGKVKTYDVVNTGPGTTTLQLAQPGAQGWKTPQDDAIWVVTGTDVAPRQYRVLTVNEKEDNIYEVTALLHHPGKFAHVERDKPLTEQPFTRVPTGKVKPASELTVSKYRKNRRGAESRLFLSASWMPSADSRVSGYNVYVQEPDQQMRLVAQTGDLNLDIACEAKVPGTYTVRVTAVTALGSESAPITASTNVLKPDVDAPPATPEGWVGTPGYDSISLTGKKHPAPDFRAHVIYGATADSDELTELAEVAGHSYTRIIPENDKFTRYKIAARTHGDMESSTTGYISVQPIPLPPQNIGPDIDARIAKGEEALAAHLALVEEYAGVGLDAKFDEIEKDIADTVIFAQAAADAAQLASDEAAKALFETTALFTSSQQRGVTQAAASRRVCLASGDYDVVVEQDDTEIFVNGTRVSGDTELGKFTAHTRHKLTLMVGDTVTSTSPLAAMGTSDGANIQLASLALAGRNFGLLIARDTPHEFTMVPLTNGQYRVSAKGAAEPGRWIPIFADQPVTFTSGEVAVGAVLIESTCDVLLASKSSVGEDQTLLFPASHEIMIHAAYSSYDVGSFTDTEYTRDGNVCRAESRTGLLFGNRVDDGAGFDTAGHISTAAFGDLYMLPQRMLRGISFVYDKDMTIEVSDANGTILATHNLVFDGGTEEAPRKWNTFVWGSSMGISSGGYNYSSGPYQVSGTSRFGLSTNDDGAREYVPMGYDRAQFVPMSEAFADAANYSAQFSASKASDAGAYAASATESVLTAEAAREASEEAKALSEAASGTAVSARDDALGAAANASDSLKLVSTARRDTKDYASRNLWLNGDFSRTGNEELYGWSSSSNATLERARPYYGGSPTEYSLRATIGGAGNVYLNWTPPSAPEAQLMGRTVRVSGWWCIENVETINSMQFLFYRVRTSGSYHSYSPATDMPLPSNNRWTPFEFEIEVPETDRTGAAMIERWVFRPNANAEGARVSFTALRMEDVTSELIATTAAEAAAEAVTTTAAHADAAGDAAAEAVSASSLVAKAAQDVKNGLVRSVPHLLTLPSEAWTNYSANTPHMVPKQPAPEANFISGDPDYGDCYDFGSKSNVSIGQSYPVEWTPKKLYVAEVGFKVEEDGSYNGGVTTCQIGIATYADTSRKAYSLSTPFEVRASDGPQVRRVLFSEKGLGKIVIDDVDDVVSSVYTGGNQAFFMLRQNSGASSNGKVRVQYIKLIDFTAPVSALEYAAEADASRVTAAEAASAANGHEAKAFDHLNLSARLVAKGASVLADQFFTENGYFVPGVYSNPIRTSNADDPTALYAIGQTLTCEVTDSSDQGIQIRSDSHPQYWRGAKNATGYVIEVEFTLTEGDIGGAGVVFDWYANSRHRQIAMLADHAQAPVVVGEPNVAIITMVRPDEVADETFRWNHLYLTANFGSVFGYDSRRAKTIQFHRLNVRVASSEEMGAGLVQATLEEYAYSKADTVSAIAAKATKLGAELAGGRLPLKGIFDDPDPVEALSPWEGEVLSLHARTDAPSGNTPVMRLQSQLATHGDFLKGDLNKRSYRFKGYYICSYSHPVKIGFEFERNGKPNEFVTALVGPRAYSWEPFDVVLDIDLEDIRAYRVVIQNDHDSTINTYWTDLEVYDVTQEQSVRATLEESYITTVEANRLQAEAKTELKGEMDGLRGDIPGYQIIFQSKVGPDGEPIDDSAPDWFELGHSSLTAESGGMAMGQTDTVLLKETASFTRSRNGMTNGARVRIPAKQATTFAGKRIKISLLARKGSASSFSLCYAPNDYGHAMAITSAEPDSLWAWHDFYCDVPAPRNGGDHWVGIWPDDSQSGRTLHVARMVIQLATEMKDLPIIETLGGQVTDILTLDTDRLTGTALGQFEQSVTASAFKGDGVLVNQYLKGWNSYSSGATKRILIPANAEMGDVRHTAWEFDVGARTAHGMYISSDDPEWRGVKNADSYTVVVDLDWISGSPSGAGILFYWFSTKGSNPVYKALEDVIIGEKMVEGRQKVEFTVKRPDGYDGDFVSNRCFVFANSANDTYLGYREAKHFIVHSIQIRPASATEAEITQMGSAIARIDGSASAAYVLRAKAGQQEAGLELVAWQDANGGGASMLRMAADDIVLDGSVTARHLEITDFSGNLIVNGAFSRGDFRGWKKPSREFAIIRRGSETSGPASDMPTEWGLKVSGGSSSAYIHQKETLSYAEGDEFTFTCKAAKAANHHADVQLYVYFNPEDQDGKGIGGYNYLSVTVKDGEWRTFTGSWTVPKGGVRGNIYIKRQYGDYADVYVTDIQLIRKRPGSTIITPNSVTTEMLQAKSVTADKLTVGISSNLLQNSDFAFGSNKMNGVPCHQTRSGGTIGSTANYDYPRLRGNTSWSPRSNGRSIELSCAGNTTGYMDLQFFPETADGTHQTGYEVTPNAFYEFHANVSHHGAASLIYLAWYGDDDRYLGSTTLSETENHGTGRSRAPVSWPRIGGIAQAPNNAYYVQATIRLNTTEAVTNAALYIARPFLGETDSLTSAWSRYEPGPTLLIDGSGIRAKSITAESAVLGDAVVDTLQIAGNALFVDEQYTFSDVFVPENNDHRYPKTLFTKTLSAYGQGGAQITVTAAADNTNIYDSFGIAALYINGKEVNRAKFGARSDGGDVEFIMPFTLSAIYSATKDAKVEVKVWASHWEHDDYGKHSFYIRGGRVNVSASKR